MFTYLLVCDWNKAVDIFQHQEICMMSSNICWKIAGRCQLLQYLKFRMDDEMIRKGVSYVRGRSFQVQNDADQFTVTVSNSWTSRLSDWVRSSGRTILIALDSRRSLGGNSCSSRWCSRLVPIPRILTVMMDNGYIIENLWPIVFKSTILIHFALSNVGGTWMMC